MPEPYDLDLADPRTTASIHRDRLEETLVRKANGHGDAPPPGASSDLDDFARAWVEDRRTSAQRTDKWIRFLKYAIGALLPLLGGGAYGYQQLTAPEVENAELEADVAANTKKLDYLNVRADKQAVQMAGGFEYLSDQLQAMDPEAKTITKPPVVEDAEIEAARILKKIENEKTKIEDPFAED